MSERGPKRSLVNAVRVGGYGETSWHVELQCGHVFQTGRKPKDSQKFCCKDCVPRPTAPNTMTNPEIDHMQELRIRSNIATQLGIPMDQVELMGLNGASVFIDAIQLQRYS